MPVQPVLGQEHVPEAALPDGLNLLKLLPVADLACWQYRVLLLLWQLQALHGLVRDEIVLQSLEGVSPGLLLLAEHYGGTRTVLERQQGLGFHTLGPEGIGLADCLEAREDGLDDSQGLEAEPQGGQLDLVHLVVAVEAGRVRLGL